MSQPAAPDRARAVASGTAAAILVIVCLVVVGCANRSTTTTATQVAPAGSAGDGAASSSAPASTGPSGSADRHQAAIDAFIASVASGDLTYRVGYSGDLRMSTRIVKIKGAMDVAGADFGAAWTYDFHDVPTHHLQVRGVDGKGYIKRQGKAWSRIKNFRDADSYVPFKAVHDATDVRYLGSEVVDGRPVYRLAIPESLLIDPTTIPYSVANEKVKDTALEIWIDDEGRPRGGTWTMHGTARIGEGRGQLQGIAYDLDLTFSKVGSKLSVKAP